MNYVLPPALDESEVRLILDALQVWRDKADPHAYDPEEFTLFTMLVDGLEWKFDDPKVVPLDPQTPSVN